MSDPMMRVNPAAAPDRQRYRSALRAPSLQPPASAVVIVLLALLSLEVAGATDNWPQFRGPNAGVAADDPALPDTWSETENVVWKTPIPGHGLELARRLGRSRVRHLGDQRRQGSRAGQGAVRSRATSTARPRRRREHRWVVHDIDFKTGKIRWTRELQVGTPPILRHLKNSFASETPATDGERVYVYFGSIGLLAALDMNGTTGLDEGARGLQRAAGVRTGRVPHRSTRTASTSSTTTRRSRSSSRSTRRPAARSGR